MSSQTSSTVDGRSGDLDPTTGRLLADARLGDARALGQLLARCVPGLARWAHGLLPRWARATSDTTDLIQDVLLRTLGRLDRFEARGRGALAAYLRQAVRNRIRDEHRRMLRRGPSQALDDDVPHPGPSPLDRLLATEAEEHYRAALAGLSNADQELIVAHLELDYTHEQLGCMLGRSRNAARMALRRAVGRLAERMRDR